MDKQLFCRRAAFLVLILVAAGMIPAEQAQPVTNPAAFFGFQPGADRRIATWDQLIAYYRLLEKQSGKLQVVEMGPSTMGNPFLLVIISSPANLANLEKIRDINARLSDPRGIPLAEIPRLIQQGKAVVCQSMSLHATEIGGMQMAPELAWELATREDEETRRILDNVIFLLVPSFNPDGAIMVSDWYKKTLGTEYEGTGLPWLYHKYAGHDNNRDAFQTNLVESQYLARIMFRDWHPQAYVDHHHMGSYGARLYVPPYTEPVRPFADPLIWREHSWYGAHIAYKEEEAGLSGILNSAQFSGWGHFGFHWITPFHNIAGMLTEAADAKLATPLFIHPSQLEGRTRGLPAYEPQTTFPNPWPGGWWRLRDIVERQKVSARAVLDLAARNRETVLTNAWLKAKRQTERGARGKPATYVIPARQHDPLTAGKLVNKLRLQGIEIQQAQEEFLTAGGRLYPAKSFVISLAQPKMGLIRHLLGQTFYPDNEWTRTGDGTPVRPYDMATDTMAEFMGVQVDPLDDWPAARLTKLAGEIEPAGTVPPSPAGYWLDGRLNDSFAAVNRLLEQGIKISRVDAAGQGLRPGDFLVDSGDPAVLRETARATGVDFQPRPAGPAPASHELRRLRAAMYQRYRGGNMDEGWTRLLLEKFSFPYASIHDDAFQAEVLTRDYDVIILPDDSPEMITGQRRENRNRPEEPCPPEYQSGLGKEKIEALVSFVKQGGTLVALGRASAFAIDKLSLPVRDSLAGLDSKTFWCPGSTLHACFNPEHPLAYGMPAEGLVVHLGSSMAFDFLPSTHNDWYEPVVLYPEKDLLQSGWLVGERFLAKRAAMITARCGNGRVILIGFRTQHRVQTHGTFKLLFNCLLR